MFVLISLYSWKNTKWLAASCQPRRSRKLLSTKCVSLPRITSWPSRVSGISCVNWRSSRRPLAKLFHWNKYMKLLQLKLRTLAFGCVMTRVPVPTTCTVNTVTCPLAVPWHSVTVIWVLVIVLVLTQFKSSKLTLFQPARHVVYMSNNSTIPRSSSHWCKEYTTRAIGNCSHTESQELTSCKLLYSYFFLAFWF